MGRAGCYEHPPARVDNRLPTPGAAIAQSERVDKMANNGSESTVTIKWVFIIALIVGIFGFFFTSVLSQENRITKVETRFESISKDVAEIKTGVNELRNMQIEQYKRGK